jgi:hypothetical protein
LLRPPLLLLLLLNHLIQVVHTEMGEILIGAARAQGYWHQICLVLLLWLLKLLLLLRDNASVNWRRSLDATQSL